ncbi:MAG: hypothetical protein ABSB33_12870 [Tepidisphaeraceae bacterium]|jgi:DNA-directed RNA polymerase subunit RPC12/RpoP
MAECANCGRQFGKLESPKNWNGNVVCAECFSRLSPSPVSPIIIREKSETPRIFKWAAWLIVIAILLFLFDSLGHFFNRHADLQEEEFRLNQHGP